MIQSQFLINKNVDVRLKKKEYSLYDRLLLSLIHILSALPCILRDTTDRNRTSPFAFTGNKFEFRMLGASQSIADPNIMLNTMVSDVLDRFASVLEQTDDFDNTVHSLIKQTLVEHKRIIFNGDGYTDDWVKDCLLYTSRLPYTHLERCSD